MYSCEIEIGLDQQVYLLVESLSTDRWSWYVWTSTIKPQQQIGFAGSLHQALNEAEAVGERLALGLAHQINS